MKQLAVLFFILLALGVGAQNRSYDQMEVDYNRFKNEGKKDSVLLVAREMNEWALKNEGDTSLRYAVSFRYIGNGFVNQDSSLVFYAMSLKTLEAQHRKNHLDYALCLYNLGRLFQDKADATRALSYFLESYEMFILLNRDDHPIYRFCLNNLAMLYLEMHDYAAAELYYMECLELTGNIYGEDHLEYARISGLLGALSKKLEDYANSENYFQEAIKIYYKNINDQYDNCAATLIQLAALYRKIYDYNKSENCLLESYEMRKKYLGEEHVECASVMINLADLYREMLRYGESEKLLLKAKLIYEKNSSSYEHELIDLFESLILLYNCLGDYKSSSLYFEELLSNIEHAYGKGSAYYATKLATCLNLGVFYLDDESYFGLAKKASKALNYLSWKQNELSGDERQLLSDGFYILALAHISREDYDEAEIMLSKALDFYVGDKTSSEYWEIISWLLLSRIEKSNDSIGFDVEVNNMREQVQAGLDYAIKSKNDILYSQYLNISTSLDAKFGDLSKAIFMQREFVQYMQSRYFSGWEIQIAVANLFHLLYQEGNYSSADSAFVDLMSWDRRVMDLARGAPGYIRSYYWSLPGSGDTESIRMNYLHNRGIMGSSLWASSLSHWLFRNGSLFDYEALLNQEVERSGDSALMSLFANLSSGRRQLLNHYELTRDEQISRGIDISMVETELKILELDFASRLESFERINAVYDFNDLYERLKPNDAYVDLRSIDYYDFESREYADSSFYIAYVVTSDMREAPQLINLGEGKQIDEILYPYIVSQTTNPTSTTMDGQVYNLLWKPLEEHLVGKTKIYLSPGGIYHSINPETIYHAETGKYLFEEKEIHLVNSGRSFVDQRIYGNRDYTDRTALIMGAPNFDYSYVVDSTLLVDNVSFTYQTMRDLSLDGNRRITPLPATRSEVEGINQTLVSTAWNTQLLTGNDALEMNLKQMDSPRILHIATHGYFLEDIKPENDNGMRMMGMDVNRVAENPMLRSGLLLAGCNKTLADNTPLTGGDNGILTAYEAGLLDLSKTELVVLSACETGKGEILNGEGVQGLRKAMTDAGAEHILMSLWKVDDKVTSEYMQTFYGHYAQGKSIRESYNLTRNEIKQKYPQPYYWGAFVLVGE